MITCGAQGANQIDTYFSPMEKYDNPDRKRLDVSISSYSSISDIGTHDLNSLATADCFKPCQLVLCCASGG